MELYKYTGSVAALTVRFGKAETITLYDSYDDSVTLYFAGDAEFHYFGNVATDLVGSDAEFRYRLLSRCIQDCKYFLGCGSRFSKYLWGCCVENHIQAMRILWDSFSDDEKPEWTSLEEIERFSKKMLEEEIY